MIDNIINSPTRYVGKATFLKTYSLTQYYVCGNRSHIYYRDSFLCFGYRKPVLCHGNMEGSFIQIAQKHMVKSFTYLLCPVLKKTILTS